MQIETTELDGVLIVTPTRAMDYRGFLSETYSRAAWADAGLDVPFVQDNHSLSRRSGTVRGLHFQIAPHEQGKLIRVLRGRIFDVAVDIRRKSSTFGKCVTAFLSAENWRQLFVPAGFAHGFMTLEPDTEVAYKLTAGYSAAHDRGIAWDDPDLGIRWPSLTHSPILSERDKALPRLRDL